MNNKYFINEAFDQAIKLYVASSLNQNGLVYNSFNVIVIRILVLIYGEDRILNPYYLRDESAFFHNLTIYGFTLMNVLSFKDAFLNFYEEEEKFLDLIYVNNNDPYRYSYKYLMDKDNYIEKYYYTKLNDFDITKTINLDTNMLSSYQLLKEPTTSNNIFKFKLTTGNGYVDILLLMSVIVTSFSIISILIFSL